MKLKIRIMAPVMLFLLAGCNVDAPTESEIISSELSFQTLAKGTYSPSSNKIRRQFKVIKNQEEYERDLSVYPEETAVSLDFERGMVLFASYGVAGANRHSIEISRLTEITRLTDNRKHIEAYVTLRQPFNCQAGAAITHPYHFIYIERAYLVVVQEALVNSCE